MPVEESHENDYIRVSMDNKLVKVLLATWVHSITKEKPISEETARLH